MRPLPWDTTGQERGIHWIWIKWIGSRLSVEPEAARPAGPEIPQPSQGFLNGVLALSSLPPLGRAPGCKVVAWEPLADTGEQAVPPLGLWTK